ncbi:MAG: methylmalonyl-CoA mutase family protein [Candidatus Eisenbacteria bacterium]|nr:methylmalonyl-CoA mutase family protein [Candidatus Eisenbacteria bacterium]
MAENKQEKLRAELEKWKQALPPPNKPGEKILHFETQSGIPFRELYTPLDTPSFDYQEKLGFPGESPFTRGIQPTMYRGKLWTMRQYAGFGSAEDTNRRFHYLLNAGQTGLSVAFDLPTQMGYDSDHELSQGEVGRVGVAIDSVDDMETLFRGIPLDKVSTSMTINATAMVLLAMYIAIAERAGIKGESLTGTIQNDILKEYVARGTYIFPPRESMRLTTDIFAYCRDRLPSWNPISVSGYHIREAGSTAVQEVAFTFANAVAYVEAAIDAGLGVDEFAPRISFFFNSHSNFFEETAKFRAARRLWAKIMRHKFGAKAPASMRLRFHTQTAGSTLTAQQPENNVVRVALQALAAVLGGTQSLHTNSFDEALNLPSETSVRTALRTQQLIAEETGVADVVDPLGGSYFVEWLTDRIEEKVEEYIKKIENMGGAVAAIERGYMQQEIHESAYKYQKMVEEDRVTIVGLNKYRTDEDPGPSSFSHDPEIERRQHERLRTARASRGEEWKSSLTALRRAAEGKENLFPYILSAVKAKATLGETCDVLREAWGEYKRKQ